MTEKTLRARRAHTSLPYEVSTAARTLGERIRLARLRRRMEQEDLARAVGTTRRTIWSIETGKPGVALGTVMAVLWKLGLLDTFAAVADPDQDGHGKVLEAARLPQRAHSAAGKLDNDF